MKTFVTATVVAIAGLAIAGADTIVIKGSDTLGAKLVPQLTEQFKSLHAGTTFDIAAEGSATGFAALIDKTAAIGMASRPAKADAILAADGRPTIRRRRGGIVPSDVADLVRHMTPASIGRVTPWPVGPEASVPGVASRGPLG